MERQSEEKIKHINEFMSAFSKETDRGSAILGAAVLDEKLREILSHTLKDCKQAKSLLREGGAISSFSARLDLAISLGLIDNKEYETCNVVRKIRNKFAHEFDHDLSFTNQSVKDHCNNFAIEMDGLDKLGVHKENPRVKFIVVIAFLCVRWLERETTVQKIPTTRLFNSST